MPRRLAAVKRASGAQVMLQCQAGKLSLLATDTGDRRLCCFLEYLCLQEYTYRRGHGLYQIRPFRAHPLAPRTCRFMGNQLFRLGT